MTGRYFPIAVVVLASLVPPVKVQHRIHFPALLSPLPPSLHQQHQQLVAKCPGGQNHTTYLRAESFAVADAPVATLIDITLSECARKCSAGVDGVECLSFEYNSEQQTCALKEARGQPFGPSVLHHRGHTPQSRGSAFFQRICIQSGELCSAPYAFERFPQHVLSGHSMEVMAANNLSECLAYCLESRRRIKVDCHSVMYYYESGQCIVNREVRRSSPHLFTSDTRFQLVDYFENNCFNVECFGEERPHWVRVEDGNYRVDRGGRYLSLSDVNAAECRRSCETNRVGSDVFPCRAYMYTPARRECQLSAESALLMKPTAVAGGAGTLSNKERVESELTPLSATHYYEKVCISGAVKECGEDSSFELVSSRVLDSLEGGHGRSTRTMTASLSVCLQRCLEAVEPVCLSVTFYKRRDECVTSERSRFTHPHLFHQAPDADYYDRLCATNAKANAPLALPAISHNYSPATTLVDSDADLLMSGADEQANTPVRHREESHGPRRESSRHRHLHGRTSMSTSIEDPVAEVVRGSLTSSASAKEVDSSQPLSERVEKKPKPSFNQPHSSKVIAIDAECRVGSVTVRATFSQPSSGSLFIKDHSANCASVFELAVEANLTIPLRSNHHRAVYQPNSTTETENCPGVEISPGVWSFLVVAQRNNIGIASLLTGGDRIFNITCDYTSTLRRNSTTSMHAEGKCEEIKSHTEKEKTPKVGLPPPPPPPPTVKMAILRRGNPVITVSLGEELELRWWFVKNDTRGTDERAEMLGFLVDSCVAERLEGHPPDPPPLPLVVDGCPDNRVRSQLMRSPIVETGDGGFNTTVRMFRFDGSRRVRIRCAVNICVERCKPASCVFASHDSEHEVKRLSYGRRRRRRRQTMGELAELIERYDRVRSEVMASRGLRRRQSPATAEQNQRDGNIMPLAMDGDDSLVQQSTTVTGSYTIADWDRRDSRAVRREGGVVYVAADDGNESDRVDTTEQPFLPTTPLLMARNSTLLSGLAHIDSETKVAMNPPVDAKCKPSSTYAIGSVACLPQGAFVALLAAASFATAILAFFSIRFVHRRCGGETAEEVDDYARRIKQASNERWMSNERALSRVAPFAPTRSSAASDSLLNFMPSMASSPLADCMPLPPGASPSRPSPWRSNQHDWSRYAMRDGRVTTFGVERRGRERPIDADQFPHMEHSPRSQATVTGRLSSPGAHTATDPVARFIPNKR